MVGVSTMLNSFSLPVHWIIVPWLGVRSRSSRNCQSLSLSVETEPGEEGGERGREREGGRGGGREGWRGGGRERKEGGRKGRRGREGRREGGREGVIL